MTRPDAGRPTGLVVGVVLLVLGIVGGIVLVATGVAAIASDARARQHVAFGTAPRTVTLTRTGKMGIWYEADLEGDATRVPDVDVTIRTPQGRHLLLHVAGRFESGTDSTANGRSSTQVGTFRAEETGLYTFTGSGPEMAEVTEGTNLGVGPTTSGGSVAAIVVGVLVGGLLTVVGAIVVIVSALRRSKNRRAAAAPGWGPGAPPGPGWGPPGSYPPPGAYAPPGSYPPPGAYPPPGSYPPPGAYPPPGSYPPAPAAPPVAPTPGAWPAPPAGSDPPPSWPPPNTPS